MDDCYSYVSHCACPCFMLSSENLWYKPNGLTDRQANVVLCFTPQSYFNQK